MKKILFLITLCFFIFSGCEKNKNPDLTEKNTKNSLKTSEKETVDIINNQDQESTVSQENKLSPAEYDFSETYYKMKVIPADYNEEAILQYLIPGFDKSLVKQEEKAEGLHYIIELNSVKHIWHYGNNNFIYFNDSVSEQVLSEEEALAYGDDFIKYFGYEVTENPDIRKEEDGSYSIVYYLQYEGVPVLGKGSIDLKNGDEEDGFAHGEYIEVWVNESGIISLYLDHLYESATILEKYQADDLIDNNKLDSIINFAMNTHFQRMGDDVERRFQVDETNLIYIPWQENGMQVLLPAFQVTGVTLERGKDFECEFEEEPLLIDAISGYVY